ncbi:hypothetical protein AYO41_01895 [Verrucomicrobia bacterium SCGC AG-212-E04]|nr:hypothetical protein AYO41_01895 [Verrucomicrobia bacterium SCGC AG-212-E04]
MNRKYIYALLLAQLLALTGLYAYHAAGLGYPVYRLRTVPVDPRDLLRGDYVILRYEISRMPDTLKEENMPASVWVNLKPDGDAWVIDNVSGYRRSDYADYGQGRPVLAARREGRELKYDLERFYVPEGKGNTVPRGGKLVVEVAVRPNGSAQIKRVLDEQGNPWPR